MCSHLHPRLLAWWKDDPADPDRPELDNPDVQQLITLYLSTPLPLTDSPTIQPGNFGADCPSCA